MKTIKRKNIKIALNDKYMKGFFEKNLNKFFPKAKEITSFSSQHLRYFSKESFAIKYEIGLLMKNGEKTKKTIRGKRIKPGPFSATEFFSQKLNKQKEYIVPKPLYYFNDLKFILYEEYEGCILRKFDHKINILERIIPQVAENLTKIHNLSLQLGKIRTINKEQKYFDLLSKKVFRYSPQISEKFTEYKNLYIKLLKSSYKKEDLIFIHGDFQASNIVYNLKTKNIGIIDFSSSSIFSPCNDIATFLTHLRAMLCFIYPAKRIEQLEKKFLKSYFKKINKKIKEIVKKDLPLYQTRVSLDIIATTAVIYNNKSSHLKKIINEMFKRVENNLKIYAK